MLGFRSRLDPVNLAVYDSMVRADQSGLGVTSDGLYTWNVLTGTWSISGNKASTSTAASSNPVAYINPGYSDIDASLSISPTGNDALYFRIVDANNWLRLKLRELTTSSTQTQYCTYPNYVGTPNPPNSPGCVTCRDGYVNCATCSCNVETASFHQYSQAFDDANGLGSGTGCIPLGGCTQSGTCLQACGTITTNFYNYFLDLEKMVSGSLGQIANISLGQSVNVQQLRVVAVGSKIEVFCTETAGTEQAQGTYTDATNSSATKHGIGRGASNSYTQDGSALGQLRITLGE